MQQPSKTILTTYLRRLTNLSGNNRSLFLLRLYAEQLLDLHELNQLNGMKSFETINALMGGKNIRMCSVLDSRVEANNLVSRKLKNLQRVDRFLFEEKGTYDLHVGWPFVRGKFSDGTPVRCPLLFFPVSIVQENQSWYLQPRQQAGVTFNKSFLLAYSFYNKVKLDEELLETNFEDFNVDSTVFRTELYQLLKDKIELNFNADNFRDELTPFKIFKREEFEQQHRQGELKLFPEAVLGIFPQAGSQLVPDYLQLIDTDTVHDLEYFFSAKNTNDPQRERNEFVKEEKLFTPFVLDAYQENAIKAIKSGKSVVVQGPPGTGKSQLICNLIADTIAAGQRVLLVCQKRAALDVVYARLQSKELGDFVGLVHDFRNERKNIFAKIARQIDNVENFLAANRSVDIIQTERRFFQVARLIDQISEELEHFKMALFNDEECGVSVKELYLTSDLQGPTINITQEYQKFPFTELPKFMQKLTRLVTYSKKFEADGYLWKDRKSFASYRMSDIREIEQRVLDVPAFQEELQQKFRTLIGISLNIEEADNFRAREDAVLAMIAMLKNNIIFDYFKSMLGETDDETSHLWLSNTERMVLNCFDGDGPEKTLAADQLVRFQEALHERMRASKNLIQLIRWNLVSKNKTWLGRVLVSNGLKANKEGLKKLEARIDSRLNLEHHLTSLRQKRWLIDLPADYDRGTLQVWFTRQKLAVRSKIIFNSLREVNKAMQVTRITRSELIALLRQMLRFVEGIPSRKAVWEQYLSPFQLRQLIYDPAIATELNSVLRKDFDSLCEFDGLKESLDADEKSIISRLYDSVGNWDASSFQKVLDNSLRLAWIEHIESKYPDLRAASTMKLEEQRVQLQAFVEEKQKLSHDILLLRARERVCENMEFNRLNNRVTYRDLYHQVTKKKKIWPLRKLITDFADEVFRVMPCWMASPEAVSAIFPMEEMFDLVIFDEASQCFAERGVPAMYRGKQVVVAGDDKQLKPHELYSVRWDEESEIPELEVDSLLELAARYLPTTHLQGHYRSQSLELIDFSNRHFYEGRLQLLPDRVILNQNEPGIEYYNVKGRWHDNTNEVEAKEVVRLVSSLIDKDPRKEIGVVTFNAPQQVLIMDLLEEAFANKGVLMPASLFVKNIENVQGDEKDIIIFSVGYAPDKNNRMAMQFGSLSAVGGENRLNVAITRAREKIILVCSIEPEQLKTDDAKNEGPRLLKRYLEFAREVHQRRFAPAATYNVKQRSEWYLSQHLSEWCREKFRDLHFGINTLPYADLHFRKDDHYMGIVLTDDVRYLTSVSVKDSFAYLPVLLGQKNWSYHMVFSRNLWNNREKTEDDLQRFIGQKAAALAEKS